MGTTAQKVIVSNQGALIQKYGTAFSTVIQPAIQRLIQADAGRGIATVVIYADDAAAMRAVSGSPVARPTDPQANKQAVDAIFGFYQPDYLMLLGAVDVVPHQNLINPAFTAGDDNGDPDQLVPSDLPYACPGGYSRSVRDFLNPTRVVGRLPDITKGTDPSVLVKAIDCAAGFTPGSVQTYLDYFAASAGVWSASTQLSLTTAFGNASALQIVPPATYCWTAAELARKSHFFNCHGDVASPKYYGQPAGGAQMYPPAHDAQYVAGKITRGTVAAAECCYGAELYEPSLALGKCGIPNQYFIDGAYGFFGSTTIAYGPDTTNDWADVLCRDFFRHLLAGASLGRSVLQARQDYMTSHSQLSEFDLKTLAQFYLLGDPSVTPVDSQRSGPSVMTINAAGFEASSHSVATAIARSARRATLAENGMALADSVGLPGRTVEPSEGIKRLLQSSLEELGISVGAFRSVTIEAPEPAAVRGIVTKSWRRLPQATHRAIGRLPRTGDLRTPTLVGVELVQYDDNVIKKPFRSR